MTGITAYGCDRHEAALFRDLAPGFGVRATVTDAPVAEDTADLAAGSRCVSIGHKTRVGRAALRALGDVGVRYVSTRSIGYNHLDVEYAESLGLTVGNVAYSPDSVADYTLMLILMSLRDAAAGIRRADRGDYRLGEVAGRELRDLTVGVVGTGRIGSAVVDRLRGFGCRVLAHDLVVNAAVVRAGATHVPLEDLLRRSDVVTLHTPLTARTHHLLDRDRIAQLKPGAVVVNTGRGPLVDTDALVAALERGSLGGAARDVLEAVDGICYADHRDGPIASDWLRRLRRRPNVLISPHTAYFTDHALTDMVANSIANCLAFEGVALDDAAGGTVDEREEHHG